MKQPYSKSFYKYKSLNNFEFILDLVLRERLYAGKYHELNDPMEGVIKLDRTIPSEHLQQWEASLNKYNICCFTKDPDNNLMWSHYADGGRGCVVQFELPPDTEHYKINYGKIPTIKATDFINLDPKVILTSKLKYWQYEQEYRCVVQETYFLPVFVKSIRFGPRADPLKVRFLIDILACCKPDLVIIRGREQSVIKESNVIISQRANGTTFTRRSDSENSDACLECMRNEHARNMLRFRQENLIGASARSFPASDALPKGMRVAMDIGNEGGNGGNE